MDRIAKAVDIQPEHIKEAINKGDFNVRSTETKDRWYQLSFGGTDGMPKCTCPDFRHSGLPCKHFFAVFEHNAEWKWDALPMSYRENPHICLDDDIVFSQVDYNDYNPPAEVQSEIKQPACPHPKAHTANVQMTEEIQVRHEATKCRETLKELTSLTYNVGNINALKELGSSLKLLREKFSSFQPTDEMDNNCSSNLMYTQKDDEKIKEGTKKKYLPLPQRLKNKFNNRVGKHASMMRSQYFVNVPLDGNIFKKTKKQQKKSVQGKSSAAQSKCEKRKLPQTVEPKVLNPPRKRRCKNQDETTDTTDNADKEVPTSVPSTMKSANTSQAPSTTTTATHTLSVSKPATSVQAPSPPKSATTTDKTSNMKSASTTQALPTIKPATTCTTHKISVRKPATAAQAPSPLKSATTSSCPIPTTMTPVPGTCEPAPPSAIAATGTQSPVLPTPPSKVPSTDMEEQNCTAQHGDSQTSRHPTFILTDENSPDPNSWITVEDCSPEDPDAKTNLYIQNRTNILRKTHWLTDSEIHAGQMLLKKHLPFVDGLMDPAIKGSATC